MQKKCLPIDETTTLGLARAIFVLRLNNFLFVIIHVYYGTQDLTVSKRLYLLLLIACFDALSIASSRASGLNFSLSPYLYTSIFYISLVCKGAAKSFAQSRFSLNPYKPSVLFLGHRQTMQTQI